MPAVAGQRILLASGAEVSATAGGLAPGQQSGRAGSAWHTPPGGAVHQHGRGGRRGTIGGLPPHLFSGFRPIANKGQQ